VAEPLSRVEKMVIVGGDGGGASRLTQDVANVLAQLPPVVESITGISLQDVVARIPGMGRRPAAPPASEPASPPSADGKNTALPPVKGR
jgi:flotillin